MAEEEQQEQARAPVGQELATVDHRHEVIAPLDVEAQRQAMEAYQKGLQSILDKSDWQDAGKGESFVKKSGWRKIAAWFSLNLEVRADAGGVDRDENGRIERAHVIVRAIAPNGRFADGDGYCDASESRFERNSKKLENDLRGTATTRAMNRAVSNLVGMGAVSAEEAQSGQEQSGPKYGAEANDKWTETAHRAAAYLLDHGDGPEEAEAVELVKAIAKDAGGYLPWMSARVLALTAAHLKRLMDPPPEPEEPGSAEEPKPEPETVSGEVVDDPPPPTDDELNAQG